MKSLIKGNKAKLLNASMRLGPGQAKPGGFGCIYAGYSSIGRPYQLGPLVKAAGAGPRDRGLSLIPGLTVLFNLELVASTA